MSNFFFTEAKDSFDWPVQKDYNSLLKLQSFSGILILKISDGTNQSTKMQWVTTTALLDRLTHRVHSIEANGPSFRLAESRRRPKSKHSNVVDKTKNLREAKQQALKGKSLISN